MTITVHPEEDVASRIAGKWLATLESTWERRGFADRHHGLLSMAGRAVSRERLERELQAEDGADVIAWCGHGLKCALVITRPGADGPAVEENVIDLSNCRLLHGRAVYVSACCTFEGLGPAVLASAPRGTAYFGYEWEPFLPFTEYGQEGLGDVVNAGLDVLHKRDDYQRREDRYWMAEAVVRRGYRRLIRRLWQMGEDYQLDRIAATLWELAFRADWVGRRAKPASAGLAPDPADPEDQPPHNGLPLSDG